MSQTDILLEAGTNEFEIVEFEAGGIRFGVNAAKVREILNFSADNVVPLPDLPPSVCGLLRVRNELFTLVDLAKHLGRDIEGGTDDKRIALLCRFNGQNTAFLVSAIDRIHRLSWSALNPLSGFLGQYGPRVTSTVELEGRLLQIVDLEHVVSDLDPDAAFREHDKSTKRRASDIDPAAVKIFIAEDSSHIRERITASLRAAGYVKLSAFDNGEAPFRAIESQAKSGKPITELVDLVISDIEMPRMDGLTLCRRVKEDLGLASLKIVLFSSLIDEQMAYKCMQVGADGYVTKPEGNELIESIAEYLRGPAPQIDLERAS